MDSRSDAVSEASSPVDAPQNASSAGDALQHVNSATAAVPSMVIRTGQAFIEVDKVDPAILKIRQLIDDRKGGDRKLHGRGRR